MRSAVAQRLSCLLRGGNMTCREGMRAFVKPAYQHESLPTPPAEAAPQDAFDTDAAALRRWREMQAAGARGAGAAAASQPHAAPRPQSSPGAPGAATGGGVKAHAAAASLDARGLPSAEEARERLRSHAAASCSGAAAAGPGRPAGGAGAAPAEAPALDWRDVVAALQAAPAAAPQGNAVLTDTFGCALLTYGSRAAQEARVR
jgi:hypothetical protein